MRFVFRSLAPPIFLKCYWPTTQKGFWPTTRQPKQMKGLNKVSLIGNVGHDPEIQYLEGNVAVAKLSVATTEIYKDKNGQNHSETEWHSVVLWRGLAEMAHKYLRKGSLVFVEGKLKTRNYDDKQGSKRYVTEIIAEQLLLLDKKTERNDEV